MQKNDTKMHFLLVKIWYIQKKYITFAAVMNDIIKILIIIILFLIALYITITLCIDYIFPMIKYSHL